MENGNRGQPEKENEERIGAGGNVRKTRQLVKPRTLAAAYLTSQTLPQRNGHVRAHRYAAA